MGNASCVTDDGCACEEKQRKGGEMHFANPRLDEEVGSQFEAKVKASAVNPGLAASPSTSKPEKDRVEVEDQNQFTMEEINNLVGHWKRDEDEITMEIQIDRSNNLQVVWDSQYLWPPSPLYPIVGSRVGMELAGEKHEARRERGPPQKLIWDDGETWLQVVK
mmetsp:Transcript_83633/g.132196  ORF Transcript_83633/g.132196 Transcript_83633/m.132196 type:complete len:163 (+) Transcript_83633:57-545(+)